MAFSIVLSLSGVERAIRGLRADDPLRPVAVVVTNRVVGEWLKQGLFAKTGHLGLDFLLSHELAFRVAAPGLLREGRGLVPENVGLAILKGAIPEAIGHPDTPAYLREAAFTAGFGPAALRTLGDLAAAELRPEALEAEAPGAADPERLRLVARLWRGFEIGLEQARLVDRAALYGAAARAMPSPLIGAVVLHGFHDPAPAEAAFFEALRQHHPLVAAGDAIASSIVARHAARQVAVAQRLGVVWDTIDAPAEGSLARMQTQVFAPAKAPPQDLDGSVQVLAAAGESLEAVEIARLIQQACAITRSRCCCAAPPPTPWRWRRPSTARASTRSSSKAFRA